MTIKVQEKFYTLTEAAAQLNVERHTIWRWIKGGKLESQKIGNVVLLEKGLIDDLAKMKG